MVDYTVVEQVGYAKFLVRYVDEHLGRDKNVERSAVKVSLTIL